MSAYFIQQCIYQIYFLIWNDIQSGKTNKRLTQGNFFFNIPKPSVPHHYNNLHLKRTYNKTVDCPIWHFNTHSPLCYMIIFWVYVLYSVLYTVWFLYIFTMMVFFYSFHHNVFVLNPYTICKFLCILFAFQFSNKHIVCEIASKG